MNRQQRSDLLLLMTTKYTVISLIKLYQIYGHIKHSYVHMSGVIYTQADLFCEAAVNLSVEVKQMCIISAWQVPLPIHFCCAHREIAV